MEVELDDDPPNRTSKRLKVLDSLLHVSAPILVPDVELTNQLVEEFDRDIDARD